MEPSSYQKAIYEFVANGKGNGIVEAVAGSGKTTTIVQSLDLLDQHKRILFLAFNKHIATELSDRVPFGCEARTMHSLGLEILRKYRKVQIKQYKIDNILKYQVFHCDTDKEAWNKCVPYLRTVSKLISLMKSLSYGHVGDINILADKYDIELHGEFDDQIVIDTWNNMLHDSKMINFDDMIWLPVYENLDFPKYDYVFVDEAQDLSPIQVDFVSRLLSPSSRLLAVGDTHQAIYGFRGADTEAMNRIRQRFNATELPLSLCYRCAKSIVREAKTIVPQIEEHESQVEGKIQQIKKQEFREILKPGDYVLCRVTADLVTECMHQIRNRKKAVVKGRDIGESLVSMIKNLKAVDWEDFLEKLETWKDNSLANCKDETKAVLIEDKYQTIRVLAEDLNSVQLLIDRIQHIFTEELDGIIFSTIHKSKGLEAKNIFILRGDLLPHPRCKRDWQIEQEKNVKYVAITRAQETLTWVSE